MAAVTGRPGTWPASCAWSLLLRSSRLFFLLPLLAMLDFSTQVPATGGADRGVLAGAHPGPDD